MTKLLDVQLTPAEMKDAIHRALAAKIRRQSARRRVSRKIGMVIEFRVVGGNEKRTTTFGFVCRGVTRSGWRTEEEAESALRHFYLDSIWRPRSREIFARPLDCGSNTEARIMAWGETLWSPGDFSHLTNAWCPVCGAETTAAVGGTFEYCPQWKCHWLPSCVGEIQCSYATWYRRMGWLAGYRSRQLGEPLVGERGDGVSYFQIGWRDANYDIAPRESGVLLAHPNVRVLSHDQERATWHLDRLRKADRRCTPPATT